MYKVLIATADPHELNTLSTVVKQNQYCIEICGCVSDGERALHALKTKDVDIFIVDSELPGIDGVELMRKIHSIGVSVSCILLANPENHVCVQDVIFLQPETLLLKPVSMQLLDDTLCTTVRKLNRKRDRTEQNSNRMYSVRESILYRWVFGNICRSELVDWFASSGIRICPDGYTVALIHTFSGHKFLDYEQQKAILQICHKSFSESLAIPPILDLDENVVIIIPQTMISRVLPTLESAIKDIAALLNEPVFAVLGSQESDYMLLQKSYRTAKQVIFNYSATPSEPIVFYADVAKDLLPISGDARPPAFINQTFGKLLLDQRYKQCYSYLDSLFSEKALSAGVTPAMLRSHAVDLTVDVFRTLRSHNIEINEIVGNDAEFLYKIINCSNMHDLHMWMKELLNVSIESLENKTIHFSPCIARAVAYIEKNYTQGLSLKVMASDLNINAAYLGQRFKAETAQSFSAYLNKTRIENAKRLLLDTNFTLSQVSQQCGYTNTSYFYNIFKKYAGQTPSQYRRNMKA